MLNTGEMPSFSDKMDDLKRSCRGLEWVEGQKRADAEAGETAGVHLPAAAADCPLIVGIGMCKLEEAIRSLCKFLGVKKMIAVAM